MQHDSKESNKTLAEEVKLLMEVCMSHTFILCSSDPLTAGLC